MPEHAFAAQDRPLVIGHRGAPGHRPEHTEASYRLALRSGTDAVEPDIVVSRDGELVVRHENEIGGTTDIADRPEFADRRTRKTVDGKRLTGWFAEDLTWAELQTLRARERLPEIRPDNTAFDGVEGLLRLRDVLAIVDEEGERRGRAATVVIEIKHPTYFSTVGFDIGALLMRELEASGWAGRSEQIIVECFELSVLDQLRSAGLDAPIVFLLEHAGAPADELAQVGLARSRGGAHDYAWYRSDAGLDSLVGRVDGVSPSKHDILADEDPHTGLTARAHARGLAVFTWTFRPENRFLEREHRLGGGAAAWGDWAAEWLRLVASGVDGVFVDHPELLLPGVVSDVGARS